MEIKEYDKMRPKDYFQVVLVVVLILSVLLFIFGLFWFVLFAK